MIYSEKKVRKRKQKKKKGRKNERKKERKKNHATSNLRDFFFFVCVSLRRTR